MTPVWNREELLQLLSLSGTLAGLSITGVTLLRTLGNTSSVGTIADDVLVVTAFLFLLCCYISFFALRTGKKTITIKLIWLADVLLLSALTSMVASGFIMLYTLW
jgi:hypothetical protein